MITFGILYTILSGLSSLERPLYEPLLGGAVAILGDRRDAISGASGMEVIIEQNDSFCFSRICGKIVALLRPRR
jgi:hypothetical protein